MSIYPKGIMTQYNTVRDRIEDMLDHLGAKVRPFVWDIVERRADGFISHLNDTIEKIIDNPEWEEEGNKAIRDYAELLEFHITTMDHDEVPEREEDAMTPEELDLIRDAMKTYVLDSLPDVPTQNGRREKRSLEELVKQVADYLDYQDEQIKNVTRDTLMAILIEWYNKNRESVEDVDTLFDDVSIFIELVHGEIDNLLNQPDASFKIESYMAQYNDELFDLLTDRDPEVDARYDVNVLDGELLTLMLSLRWISGPRNLPDSMMLDLLSLRNTTLELHNEFLSTGIELEDLIKNYDSIAVNDRMRRRLEESLASKA